MNPETLRLLVRVTIFAALVWPGRIAFNFILQGMADPLVVSALSTFGAGILANGILARGWERGKLGDFGMAWTSASKRDLLAGIGFGVGASVLILAVAMTLRLATFAGTPGETAHWSGLPILAIVLWLGAVGEELMFHGYAFQQLVRHAGPFATVLPVGVLFGWAHAGNANVSLLALINTVAWGVLLGYAYVRTSSLWLPMGIHFGWNVAQPLLGVNLSGFTMGLTGYELQWRVGSLWSGGAYGLEGGLFTTLVVSGLFFAIVRVFPERGDSWSASSLSS